MVRTPRDGVVEMNDVQKRYYRVIAPKCVRFTAPTRTTFVLKGTQVFLVHCTFLATLAASQHKPLIVDLVSSGSRIQFIPAEILAVDVAIEEATLIRPCMKVHARNVYTADTF
jgi:hypothetical protein